MDFVLKARIVIELYTTVLCVWWFERRIFSKWEKERDCFSSDFL